MYNAIKWFLLGGPLALTGCLLLLFCSGIGPMAAGGWQAGRLMSFQGSWVSLSPFFQQTQRKRGVITQCQQ
jgi:hypothetical protein